ncbi:hypothetical protein AAFX20_12120 [Vibrio chagasii]|uniref:hypothetical protein n=1 Tax=Vibrio chagasii TaxID=170679 RepID=UPI0038CDB882
MATYNFVLDSSAPGINFWANTQKGRVFKVVVIGHVTTHWKRHRHMGICLREMAIGTK